MKYTFMMIVAVFTLSGCTYYAKIYNFSKLKQLELSRLKWVDLKNKHNSSYMYTINQSNSWGYSWSIDTTFKIIKGKLSDIYIEKHYFSPKKGQEFIHLNSNKSFKRYGVINTDNSFDSFYYSCKKLLMLDPNRYESTVHYFPNGLLSSCGTKDKTDIVCAEGTCFRSIGRIKNISFEKNLKNHTRILLKASSNITK